MKKSFFGISIATALSLGLLGCASGPHNAAESTYYDAAFNDHNRAPAALTPPRGAGSAEMMDPAYLRAQADFHFAMGEAASFEGQHQKAIESFKAVKVYDKDSAQVPLRLAAEYVKIGMVTEALDHAQEAVQKNPKLVDAHLLLGGIYSSLKVYQKAIVQYQLALKHDPDNLDAPMYLGAVYAELKDFDRAIRYFEALAKNEEYNTPHLAFYYIGRIRSEQTGKKYQKAAEEAYRRALEIKPEHVDSALALSGLYLRNDQDKKALEMLATFQKEYGPSLRVADQLVQMYLELEKYDLAYGQLEILEKSTDEILNVKVKMSLVLIEQKRFPEAVEKLKEVLAMVPESDKIRFYLAAVYEEMGQFSKAVEQFLKVPSSSQYYADSVVHAAYLLKKQKNMDKALEISKRAVQEREDSPQLYAVYASLLDEKGEFKTAAALLKKGVEKFPDNVQMHFYLGTVQDRLGNREQVIETMQKVIDMDPDHVQGLNYLAYVYSELEVELDKAERLVRRAIELEPSDGYVMDTLGWILYKRGKVPEAIKALEAAHKLQPNESIIAEHLGDAYYRFQLTEKARVMYQRAVETEADEQKQGRIRAKITAIDNQEMRAESPRLPASTKDGN